VPSTALTFLQRGEIHVFARNIVFADRFHKFEGARVPGAVARTQRAKYLTNGPVLMVPGYRDEHARWMAAERCHKPDLLLGGNAGRGKIGRSETFD